MLKFGGKLQFENNFFFQKTSFQATGLGIGIYIIISLVVLIVLACIGYCIWQKYFREKEPEPKTQDAEKGDYNAVPKSDPDQSVPPSK